MRRLPKTVLLFFTQNGVKVYLVPAVALLLTLLVEFICFTPSDWLSSKSSMRMAFLFCALLACASCYRYRLVKAFTILFLLLTAINFGLLAACQRVWQTKFSATIFLSIINTSPEEVRTMSSTILPYLLWAILYFTATVIFMRLSSAILRKANYRQAFQSLTIIALGTVVMAFLTLAVYLKTNRKEGMTYHQYWHYTPFYFIEAAQNSFENMARQKAILPLLDRVKAPSIVANSTQNVILILGESARRDALSIYGQRFETTPNAKKRIENLLIYDSAVAPAPHTLFALPPILSASQPSQSFALEDLANNIVHLANLSYLWHTYWISNQNKFGIYDSQIATISSLAQSQRWMMPPFGHDEVLLPYLDSALRDGNPKRFIIMHLFGSHMFLKDRFPKSFDIFHLPDENLAAYLNSIRYTDHIVEEIIRRVETTPSIVIYLSDHGQGRVKGRFVHQWSKKGVEVPYYIWHSNLVDTALQRSGRIATPISTSSLFETLKFYLGLKTPNPKPDNPHLTVCEPNQISTFQRLPEGN